MEDKNIRDGKPKSLTTMPSGASLSFTGSLIRDKVYSESVQVLKAMNASIIAIVYDSVGYDKPKV